MKRSAIVLLLIGVAAFTALLIYEGVGPVMTAFAAAGWGVLAVAAYHIFPIITDAGSLVVLDAQRLKMPEAMRLRWISESVNSLLPVAQMGGPVVMARLLIKSGTRAPLAGAAVTISTTQQMLSQAVFALIGVVLLAIRAHDPVLLWSLLAGIVFFGGMAWWFYRLQRKGLFVRLARLLSHMSSGRTWLDLTGGAAALDQAVEDMYLRPRAVWASFWLNLLGWLFGSGEVWLALYFLGHPVSLLDAMLLESLGQAIRGIAFAIPGALGVQEGGYLLLGTLLGVPSSTSLALSLTKRAREIILGVPGLLYWQYLEGRFLRRARRAAAAVGAAE